MKRQSPRSGETQWNELMQMEKYSFGSGKKQDFQAKENYKN